MAIVKIIFSYCKTLPRPFLRLVKLILLKQDLNPVPQQDDGLNIIDR